MSRIQQLKGCSVMFYRFGIAAGQKKRLGKKEVALAIKELRPQLVAPSDGEKQCF